MVGYSYVDYAPPAPKYQPRSRGSPGIQNNNQNAQFYDIFMDKLLQASMANQGHGQVNAMGGAAQDSVHNKHTV